MSRLRELATRALGVFRRRRAEAEISEEIAFHLEMAERDLRRRGRSPEDARREARVAFGGVTQVREVYAAQRGLPWAETFLQDVRYGARMLRRTPAMTTAAIVTLALGIGANTAMFSVAYHVLLRPLPFAAPDRIVLFGDRGTDGQPATIGFATWQDYRDRSKTLESTAAFRPWQPTLVVNGEAEPIPAMRVSWNYFDLLGVRPALGRSFRQDEDTPERWRAVVISDGLWRRRFGTDPHVVGRTIRMNDYDYQVVGVLPPEFQPLVSGHFYTRAEMWAALGYDTTLAYACRTCQHLRAIGRVREGTSLESAEAELDAIRTQLLAAHPAEYAQGEIGVISLPRALAGPVRTMLTTLAAAVGFVLLIACANVANLLLARSQQRSREMTLRAALGAARSRLARQLLTENLLLSVAGGAAGAVLAVGLTSVLTDAVPVSMPRLDQVRIDGAVLAFASGLSLLAGLLFGLPPAWQGAGSDLRHALAGAVRVAPARRRSGGLLIAADIALALLLLAGAGLMLRSVARLASVDPGFDPAGVFTLRYSLVGTAYAEDAATNAFTERLVERVGALPGVEAAAAVGQIPMGGGQDSWGFHIRGRVGNRPADAPSVERYSITPAYFRALSIPLRAGRAFTSADRAGAAPVIIVSETTATSLWPGESPLGAQVRIGGAASGPWRTVVGIVGDVRHEGLDTPAPLQMYLPQAQVTDSFLVLAVRARSDSGALAAPIRAIVREMDPAVPVFEAASLRDLVERTTAERRFVMDLLGGFAGLALLLAAIGVYGVVSGAVAAHTREVAIRIALGARRRDVLRLVVGTGVTAIVAGLAAGLAAALVLARFMKSLLFEVPPTDPATLLAAGFTLALVALLAHGGPLRRALRLDPNVALKQD